MRGNGRSDIIKSFGIAYEWTFRCEELGGSRFLSDPKANPIEREKIDEQTLNLKSVRHFG